MERTSDEVVSHEALRNRYGMHRSMPGRGETIVRERGTERRHCCREQALHGGERGHGKVSKDIIWRDSSGGCARVARPFRGANLTDIRNASHDYLGKTDNTKDIGITLNQFHCASTMCQRRRSEISAECRACTSLERSLWRGSTCPANHLAILDKGADAKHG